MVLEQISAHARHIFRRYVLALAVLVALVAASFVTIQEALKLRDREASIINEAGRQRMLSQQIVIRSLAVTLAASHWERMKARHDLGRAVRKMEASYSVATADRGEMSASMRAIYETPETGIDAMLARFLADARTVIREGAAAGAAQRRIADMAAGPLLEQLDAAVTAREAEARDRAETIRLVVNLCLFGILLALGALALFIFRPLMADQRRALIAARNSGAELEAERTVNALQRQFVAMVSHEFRNPLAIIDASASRFLRKADRLEPPKIVELAQPIRQMVARMVSLMETIMTAGKLEHGQIEPNFEPVNLPALIEDIVGSARILAPEHEIVMRFNDLGQVRCDPLLLRHAISNLITNAVKYSPAGTMVRIDLADAGSAAVRLSVIDQGNGIPEHEIPQLFDRFFRGSDVGDKPGSGIGLHLVKTFVEMHGGAVRAESSLGSGSRFEIDLPRTPPESMSQAA